MMSLSASHCHYLQNQDKTKTKIWYVGVVVELIVFAGPKLDPNWCICTVNLSQYGSRCNTFARFLCAAPFFDTYRGSVDVGCTLSVAQNHDPKVSMYGGVSHDSIEVFSTLIISQTHYRFVTIACSTQHSLFDVDGLQFAT